MSDDSLNIIIAFKLRSFLIKDPDDYKAAIQYYEMIGIGYCTKQCDKKIDDSIYINNMLMPGQKYKDNKENKGNKEIETWGCGYHGDNGNSFCSEPYDLSRYDGYTAGYTVSDAVDAI